MNKQQRKQLLIPINFTTFVVKYDESHFFPKRRNGIDRNRHICTWRCVYSDKIFLRRILQIQKMFRKICSPLHFRVVDSYNGGSNGIQFLNKPLQEHSEELYQLLLRSFQFPTNMSNALFTAIQPGKGDSIPVNLISIQNQIH